MNTVAPETRESAGERIVNDIYQWLREDLGGQIPDSDLAPERADTDYPAWRFPCPRARYLGNVPENPHPHKGGLASYDGNPHAFLFFRQGQAVMSCRCCTGEGQMTPEEYTEEVISELELTVGNVQSLGPQWVEERRHTYHPLGKPGVVHRRKMRKGRSKAAFWPVYVAEDGNEYDIVKDPDPDRPRQRRAEDLFNTSLVPALGHYNRHGLQERPHAVVVFCEGEKDCDTAERLIHEVGEQERFVATTIASMTARDVAEYESIKSPFIGRTVITVFDNDQAGDNYRNHWPQAMWDVAARWSDAVPPERDTDLTDWVEAGATAAEFIALLENAEPVTERPVAPDHWRLLPARNPSAGTVKTGHPLNGIHVLRYHPDLAKTIRTHKLTGQIVTLPSEFSPDGAQVWPRPYLLSTALMSWLAEQGVQLEPKAFNVDVLTHVAMEHPPYNPHEATLSAEWDGVGRAETLFSTYLPLTCAPEQQRALSRLFLSDLARALDGAPRSETSTFLCLNVKDHFKGASVVGRMSQDYAAAKVTQRVSERDVAALVKNSTALIQYPAACLHNFQNFQVSAPVLNAGRIEIAPSEFVGAPAFLFIGGEGEDQADMPPNAFVETLDLDNALPGLDAVMPQMLTEAAARRREWEQMDMPVFNTQVMIEAQRDRLGTIGEAVARYVFHDVRSETEPLRYDTILRAGPLPQPRPYIELDDFLWSMEHYLKVVYGTQKNNQKIRTEFHKLRRLLDPESNRRFYVTPGGAKVTGMRFDGGSRGGPKLWSKLEEFLGTIEGGPEGPSGGGGPGSPVGPPRAGLDRVRTTLEEPRKSSEISKLSSDWTTDQPTSNAYVEESLKKQTNARAHTDLIKGGVVCPEEQAVAEILASPGNVGIDFETTPNGWRAEKGFLKEAGKLPKQKAEVDRLQRKIEFEGAAPRRKPCVLTVAHVDGRTAYLRLTGTLAERREALARVFSHVGEQTHLVAHNATFEAEVLYQAGVEVPIDCTMIAAKLIYAEAFAWDDDDESGDFVPVATEEEDVGMIDPATGELDVSRVQPIGKMRGRSINAAFSLKACMRREFGEVRDKTLRDVNWDGPEASAPEYVAYALEDAVDAVRLWTHYRDAMHQLGIWEGYRNLVDALPAVAEINCTGMVLDEARYHAFRAELTERVAAVTAQMEEVAPGVPIAAKNFNDAMRWWVLEQLWDGLLDHEGDTTQPRFAEVRAEADWEAMEQGTRPYPTGAYWTALCNVVSEAGYELAMTAGTVNAEGVRIHGMGLDKGGRAKLLSFLDESGVAPRLFAFMKLYTQRNVPATLLANTAENFHAMRDSVTGRITGSHQIAGAVTGRQNCCLTGDSLVLTNSGWRRMDALRKGDHVWTHKRRWRPLADAWRVGRKKTYEVILSNGDKLVATDTHRFYTTDGTWVSVEELSRGRVVKLDTPEAKYTQGREALPQFAQLHDPGNRGAYGDHLRERQDGAFAQPDQRRAGDATGAPLRGQETRIEEPDVRKDAGAAPSVEGRLRQRPGVQDAQAEGRSPAAGTPDRSGVHGGNQVPEAQPRGASHRRGQDQQSSRQPGNLHTCGAPHDPHAATEELTVLHVDFAGVQDVYDISVEEDESYLSGSVFSHNSKINLQQVPSEGLAREMFVPARGNKFIVADYSQVELRVGAVIAEDEVLIDVYRRGVDVHTATAARCFHVGEDEVAKDQRRQAKAVNFGCIIEGAPVLTERRGLVPIEDVRLSDRVWDGVEWVAHAGVVCHGVRDVITVDGVTGTPDHKVYFEDGSHARLDAVGRRRIARTERDGQAVRLADSVCAAGVAVPEGVPLPADQVPHMQRRSAAILRQSAGGKDPELSVYAGGSDLRTGSVVTSRPTGAAAAAAMGCDQATLHQPEGAIVAPLRGAGDCRPLRQHSVVRGLHPDHATPPNLQGGGDRQDQQRRALCAGQSAPCHATSEPVQYATDHAGGLRQPAHTGRACLASAEGGLSHVQPEQTGDRTGVAGWEVDPSGVGDQAAQKARVYDILNAGPRHRFTVSGRLVSNSFYGAAGPAIAASLGTTLSEGEELLSRFLDAYPGVAAYRERTSGESGEITILPGRRVMAMPDLHGPKRTNYPIQGAAASVQHVALTRLFHAIRARNWQDDVKICAAVHDEIVVECPETRAEDVRQLVAEAMTDALLDIMPDCVVMGKDRLVDAGVCDSWAEKS